jgi:hypothetical protein
MNGLLIWNILYLSAQIAMVKMEKLFLIFILIPMSVLPVKAQQEFDTTQFNKHLEFANWLVDYEYFTQLAIDNLNKQPDVSATLWFSYNQNNNWHTIGGNFTDDTFRISRHVITDTLFTVSDYTGISDTVQLTASGTALSKADDHFQLIRDTCRMYFNSFLKHNADQTISVWYFPAFQPSGQAIYGCEWEYIFDKSGKNLLTQNSYCNNITSVWVGQPRELWLNFRNTDKPTVGSLFFVQSFRDYFTRIRIDTRISTSTLEKDGNGIYYWTHKMK